MVEPPTPVDPGTVTADLTLIEENRAVLRQALKSRGEKCAAAQDPNEANEWADACLKLSQALSNIDPSLHPQKDSGAVSKAQGGSGGSPKKQSGSRPTGGSS